MKVVNDMESEKEKWFIIDAVITLKAVATSIEEAKKKIKNGEGIVVSYSPPRHECWLRDEVVYTCDSCEGVRCVLGQSSIEYPIDEPQECPHSKDCCPNWSGPYSGCEL